MTVNPLSNSNKEEPFNPWHFVWISILASEILTALLNTLQSFIWFGHFSPHLVMIGAIDGLFVPLIIAPVIIFFIRRTDELQRINGQLQTEITNRQHAEQALAQTENHLRTLINAITESEFLIDAEGKFLIANETTAFRLGKSTEELKGKCLYDYIPSEVAGLSVKKTNEVIHTGMPAYFEDHRSGRYFDNSVYPIRDPQGNITTLAILEKDITERKRADEERERLILDHLNAITRINKLNGLLPICSSCKKIRDDEGYWTQLEAYISEHSDTTFTHSLCPECAAKTYAELDAMRKERNNREDSS